MFSVPIIYSVYKRYSILKKNLELFNLYNIKNIFFILDSSPVEDINNLKCINEVNNFCKKNGSQQFKKNINYGYHCLLIDFYKTVDTNWLKDYHILLEDDFLLSKDFFLFHQYISKNYRKFNYKAITPFGFNVGNKDCNLFEVEASNLSGCLWGTGYNSEEVKKFFKENFYVNFKEDYLDLSFLKYLSSKGERVLMTTHNLLSYEGLEDSRDKEQLVNCRFCKDIFIYKSNFNLHNLLLQNSYAEEYLKKHAFYVNYCKE